MNVYSEALDLVAATPDTSPQSKLWARSSEELAEARKRFNDGPAFIGWLTHVNYFTAPHLRGDPLREVVIDDWLQLIEPPVDESPHVHPDAVVQWCDRRISTALLQHTYYARQIDTVKPLRVLEIGAGYGGLARILCLKMPRQYTVVDLPNSLFCSYVYLKTHFPDRIHVWALDAADLDAPADFRYVPAHLAEDLKSHRFDLGVNTCSLGEMLPENRDQYLSLIAETCGYFYSHNREGARFHTLPEDTALPALTLGKGWEVLIDEIGGDGQTDREMPPSRELLVKRCRT